MFPNGLKCICVEAVGGVLRLGMMLRIGGAIGQCVVLVGFLWIRVRTDLLNSIAYMESAKEEEEIWLVICGTRVSDRTHSQHVWWS